MSNKRPLNEHDDQLAKPSKLFSPGESIDIKYFVVMAYIICRHISYMQIHMQ